MFKLITIGMTLFAAAFVVPNAYSLDSISDLKCEFQFTSSEKEHMEAVLQFAKKSGKFDLNRVLEAAFDGNSYAMYIAGQCLLSGTEAPINREAANQLFKMAASIGNKPAQFELSQIYANDYQDPLLSLVYLNIVSLTRDEEFRKIYLQKEDLILKIAGERVTRKLLNIATDKHLQILDNVKELRNSENWHRFALSLMINNIASEDHIYDKKYWKSLFSSHNGYVQFFERRNSGDLMSELYYLFKFILFARFELMVKILSGDF